MALYSVTYKTLRIFLCTVNYLTDIRRFIQSHLPPAALVSLARMASLVSQGHPSGMDVIAVTEIRDPRDLLDHKGKGRNLCPGSEWTKRRERGWDTWSHVS